MYGILLICLAILVKYQAFVLVPNIFHYYNEHHKEYSYIKIELISEYSCRKSPPSTVTLQIVLSCLMPLNHIAGLLPRKVLLL